MRGGARPGAGRKAWEPTPDQRKLVKTCAAFGIPEVEIAQVVGCTDKTLRKYCRHELDVGATEALVKVANFLFLNATGAKGDTAWAVTAAIFWMKTRGGWREVKDSDNGSSGQTIIIKGGLPE